MHFKQTVAQTKTCHPNAGEIMVNGHLEASGIHVQRQCVRNAIHHVDRNVSDRK